MTSLDGAYVKVESLGPYREVFGPRQPLMREHVVTCTPDWEQWKAMSAFVHPAPYSIRYVPARTGALLMTVTCIADYISVT